MNDGRSELDDCGYDLIRPYEDWLSNAKEVPIGAPDLRHNASRKSTRKGAGRPKPSR